MENRDKDTSLPRLLYYILERGAAPTYGNLRLYLIGAGISGRDALRKRYVERYAEFHETLAREIAKRAPEAEADYLTWLLLTVMDGVLVQRQLENPVFDAENFIRRTAAVANTLCHEKLPEGSGPAAT